MMPFPEPVEGNAAALVSTGSTSEDHLQHHYYPIVMSQILLNESEEERSQIVMQFPTDFYLVAELTNRCNFACLHCFRTNNVSSQPDLPVAIYEKLLKECSVYHASEISLTGGGEPTLHQEFETILALTARYRYFYTLVTNGWTFEQVYPLLIKYRENLRKITFSLDGATAATHDAIRRQPGSYQKVMHACLICYYKQLPFSLSMAIHRLNAAEIDAFLALAAKLGADSVNLGMTQLTKELVARRLALSPQEREQIGAKMLAVMKHSPTPINVGFDFLVANPCFPCKPLQLTTLDIDYTGCVRFCGQLSGYQTEPQFEGRDVVGNLKTRSVLECHEKLVWNVAEFQAEKLKRLAQGTLTAHDYFPCFYCARYFHKLNWLEQFPDSEWMMRP